MFIVTSVQLSFRPATVDLVPPGRHLDLPGRGRTFVVDVDGPSGRPPLFLIHGLAVNAYLNWFPAFGPLSQRQRVVAMDLRGHGRGMPLEHRFRLADCADDVVAVADALGIDRFIPVGYSLGGPVAQLVWHRHPERVAGMVLCATSRNFGGTPQERWFYSSLIGAIYGIKMARNLPGPFGARTAPAPYASELATFEGRVGPWAMEELRRTSASALLQAMNAMGRFSSHAWIAGIDVPTAVVVTTKDRLIAPDRQLKLARAIRGSTLHPARAGHAACVLGAERFVPALLEACDSVAGRVSARA